VFWCHVKDPYIEVIDFFFGWDKLVLPLVELPSTVESNLA
jgi:hypothetical protein